MNLRIASTAILVMGLLACSRSPSPEGLPEIPANWRHLKITEIGRTEIEPESDQNGLHIHFKDWTRAALLEDVIKSMKAAGYEHTQTRHNDLFYGFERPGEQLVLKIDGGDGNLYVDIFNGKGGGADGTMHKMTFSNLVVKEEVIRSDDQVSLKQYSIDPAGPTDPP